MAPHDELQQTLHEVESRRHRQSFWRTLWNALSSTSVLLLISLTLYKVLPLSPSFLLWQLGVLISFLVLKLMQERERGHDPERAARWLDSTNHWSERITTAWELSAKRDASPWAGLVVGDALKRLQKVKLAELLPWKLPREAYLSLLFLVATLVVGFIPERRSVEFKRREADAAHIQSTGQIITQLVRKETEKHTPVLPATQLAMTQAGQLGLQLQQQKLTREEALRDLSNVAEKLKQESEKIGQDRALKRMQEAARTGGSEAGNTSLEQLQKQADALQKMLDKAAGLSPEKMQAFRKQLEAVKQQAGRLGESGSNAGAEARQQMGASLGELSRQGSSLGLDVSGLEKAMQALAQADIDSMLKELAHTSQELDKLQQLAQQLQQLQSQISKAGKNLAEQLKLGQASMAQGSLDKMIEQLKKGGMDQASLDRLKKEIEEAIQPGGQYGKVGELLKQSADQLKQGKSAESSKSLTDARDELERLQQQMGDSQSLMATLDALRRAQESIASGNSWGQCKSGGAGEGGKPGRGVGTWTEEFGWQTYPDISQRWDNTGIDRPDIDPRGQSDRGDGRLADNLQSTRLKGQMSPGGSMPSITLKGVSIRGQSSVAYEEAAAAAQAEAQSALNQDKVPRAYQGAVRDYFDDFKK